MDGNKFYLFSEENEAGTQADLWIERAEQGNERSQIGVACEEIGTEKAMSQKMLDLLANNPNYYTARQDRIDDAHYCIENE